MQPLRSLSLVFVTPSLGTGDTLGYRAEESHRRNLLPEEGPVHRAAACQALGSTARTRQAEPLPMRARGREAPRPWAQQNAVASEG